MLTFEVVSWILRFVQGRSVSNHDRTVGAGRDQPLAIGRKSELAKAGNVAAKCEHLLAGCGVPDLDGTAQLAGGQPLAARMIRQVDTARGMATQGLAEPPGVHFPEAHGAVAAGRSD